MKAVPAVLAAVFLAACADFHSFGLKPGESRLEDVQRALGRPAMRWQDPDGSVQLSYPTGPMGTRSYMAHLAPDGKLRAIENVMQEQAFARIQPGMNQDQVLRILGPSYPGWTVYFKARDELVWEWRYCDAWNESARFNVLFDNTRGTVRSTLSLTESQRGLCDESGCWCGR